MECASTDQLTLVELACQINPGVLFRANYQTLKGDLVPSAYWFSLGNKGIDRIRIL